MNLKKIIIKELKKKKEIKVADIVKITGFSRGYISKTFKELKENELIFQIGKANQSRYVLLEKKNVKELLKKVLKVKKILKNKNLSEGNILERIKRETGIFLDLPKNISNILDYAFSEILNNAIEHSKSNEIELILEKTSNKVIFKITDFGVGIFNNIKKKRKLKNDLEAIQDLLKGKQTTVPREHSGEGIFFTSRASDKLVISSFGKRLIIDNQIKDIFIEDVRKNKGTIVDFEIEISSKKKLEKLFRKYSEEAFAFDKTEVVVDLYNIDTDYISRSQARRVLSGLDKFKKIIFDFQGVKIVGQAFADEVFRVWNNNHKTIKIIWKNANENIEFMIKRALERK